MSDRFPYNLPSEEALVELVRRDMGRPNLKDEYITFEDLFFSPTEVEPGRTYVEMIDQQTNHKDWFEFRRLNLSDQRCLGPVVSIKVLGDPTPANIAAEINRSRKMPFGPGDISFSDELLPVQDTSFEYDLIALTGSYVYFGQTKVLVEIIPVSQWTRYLQAGSIRYTEEGVTRELEHRISRWS